MAIKLVTFDLDNTLWENDSVIHRAEKSCYEFLQMRVPGLVDKYSQDQLAQLRLQLMAEMPHLSSQISKVRKLSIQRALEAVKHDSAAIPDLTQDAFEHFLSLRNKVELFPQAIPVLHDLKSKYLLGSISNGNSDLEKIGIAEYFSFSLTAEKIGASKPRPNIFYAALHKANTKPDEVIHIGDHHVDDVLGAQQMGMHTIWFNPKKILWKDISSHKEPTATVSCLSELPKKIDDLARLFS